MRSDVIRCFRIFRVPLFLTFVFSINLGRHKPFTMKRTVFTSLLLFLIPLMLLACRDTVPAKQARSATPVKVGISLTPLLGPFYAAQGAKGAWNPQTFTTSGEIGYALLAGTIDAGFVETAKALNLLKAPDSAPLKVAGTIQFPYGATLVLRKGLHLRLPELAGRRVAVLDDHCVVKEQFEKDAVASGLNPKKLLYRTMPFADMLPALEAKAVDAIVVKGSYAVLAERAGHTILYQKWDMAVHGDDCCPPAIAQTEFFLLVREEAVSRITPLVNALKATADLPPSAVRQAVTSRLGYPPEALEQYPTPTFAPLSDDQVKLLGEARCLLTR